MRFLVIFGLLLQNAPSAAPPDVRPEFLNSIEREVNGAVERREIPGAVVVFGRHGKVIFEKAFGNKAVEPAAEAMTVDTLFDLASVTKPIATATSILILMEEGKIQLSDKVTKFIPEFAGAPGRENITIEQLLTHRAGFAPDDPLELYEGTREEIFKKKYRRPLAHPPESKFIYSDVGYEVLGEMVRIVSGKELHIFAKERIFDPLQMTKTTFRPLEAGIAAASVAPTEKLNTQFLRGVVHDPRARALGEVAGHAGLFGTGGDLAKYCIALLRGGAPILKNTSIPKMIQIRDYKDSDLRTPGWDAATGYSGPRGDLYPIGSFGHTGFTGTSLWLDPSTDSFIIILTNAVHLPKGTALPLRRKLGTLAALCCKDVDWISTLQKNWSPEFAKHKLQKRPVLAGVDALSLVELSPLHHKKIGLVTNHTGRTADGASTIDLLNSPRAKFYGVDLVRLFSPEHGIRGAADEKVKDSVDEATRLPIVSLYGERRRPRAEDLAGLDAIVIDLQEAGCRFYTYLATTAYVMEEAAKLQLKVMILDRPNPIGAARFEGAPADVHKTSFISYHSIPQRTGLTIGEFARLARAERIPNCILEVIPMPGYRPELYYNETELPWVAPSPNLRSVDAALVYPGICMLEFTNISVGRGTDAPFIQFGAPWLDKERLVTRLANAKIPGFQYSAVEFTPADSIYIKEKCFGASIQITDRAAAEPVRLGFEIACYLRDEYPQKWDRARFPELIANDAVIELFQSGASAEKILYVAAESYPSVEERYKKIRLYPFAEIERPK